MISCRVNANEAQGCYWLLTFANMYLVFVSAGLKITMILRQSSIGRVMFSRLRMVCEFALCTILV